MPIRDREARNAYQLAWMRNRREKWFATNGPCVVCGSWDRLELDHVDPNSKVDHKVWSWSEYRTATELARCVAKCYDCHLLKSGNEKLKGSAASWSKATEDQVRSIRSRYAAGTPQKQLAAEYGLHKSTISDMIRRKSWAHLD